MYLLNTTLQDGSRANFECDEVTNPDDKEWLNEFCRAIADPSRFFIERHTGWAIRVTSIIAFRFEKVPE